MSRIHVYTWAVLQPDGTVTDATGCIFNNLEQWLEMERKMREDERERGWPDRKLLASDQCPM